MTHGTFAQVAKWDIPGSNFCLNLCPVIVYSFRSQGNRSSWRPQGGGAEAGFASRESAPGSSTDPSMALGVAGAVTYLSLPVFYYLIISPIGLHFLKGRGRVLLVTVLAAAPGNSEFL